MITFVAFVFEDFLNYFLCFSANAFNFYSIKYINLFWVLYAFFVYNIVNSLRWFFYFAVTALSRRLFYSPFANLYMFQVLCAGVSVLFDGFIVFKPLFNFLSKSLFNLQNLIWCTKSIMSSSNAIRSFTCGEFLRFHSISRRIFFSCTVTIVFVVVLHVLVFVVPIVKFHIVEGSFPPNFFDSKVTIIQYNII